MDKCTRTISGKHIWGDEVVAYTFISKDELGTKTMPKCRACGLYDDVNIPTEKPCFHHKLAFTKECPETTNIKGLSVCGKCGFLVK